MNVQDIKEAGEKAIPEIKEVAEKTKRAWRDFGPGFESVVMSFATAIITKKLMGRRISKNYISAKHANAQLANDFALAKGDFTNADGSYHLIQFEKRKL